MGNVDWLLREANDERMLRVGRRMCVDDSRWRATVERVDIGSGLRVFLTQAEAHRDLTVEARDDRTDRWVGSQVTIAGRANIDFLDGGHALAAADRALLFRPAGRAAAYSLAAGMIFHSAGYGLNLEHIRRLFDGEVPDVLGPLLEPEVAVSRILTMRGDQSMRRLAASLFARGLNGPLRILMMEGAVIQLLAVQAAAAGRHLTPQRDRTFSKQERSDIEDARERLLADMRDPPSLGALAAAVGLSEKRLNVGFRAMFGTTVFEALRNERLEHARIVLESSALSLKDVAFRVGYNHVSNFINAFSARYGAPPRKFLGRRR